jgi:nicotinamidase-related amidase
MPSRHPNILSAETALLVLIDLQEPFLQSVDERDRVLDRCGFLAASAEILKLPIIATVQYAARMGGVVDGISRLAPSAGEPLDKMCFSCAGSDAFLDRVRSSERRQILIAGIETHICVAQTALDLLHHGYQVHVAADAVSSRGMDRHKLGMEKIRDAGGIPCSAEQAVFELLQESGTAEFKRVLGLVKG